MVKSLKKEKRPWGNFKQFVFNEKCTVKIIEVKPNQTLSKQVHRKRDELWVVLDKGLRVELDDKVINPKPGDEVVIKRKTIHRLSSLGRRARVLEISFGNFDESDVERLEDVYGRV